MSTQKIKKIIKKFPGKYLPGNRALRSISRTIVRVVFTGKKPAPGITAGELYPNNSSGYTIPGIPIPKPAPGNLPG
jgi:hypothetical protein